MTNSLEYLYINPIFFSNRYQTIDINCTYISRNCAQYGGIPLGSFISNIRGCIGCLALFRHHIVNHRFSLSCDAIHNVIDTNGPGNVEDKKQQPAYAGHRHQHSSEYSKNRGKRKWYRACRGHGGYAIQERTQINSQCVLGYTVINKGHNNTW